MQKVMRKPSYLPRALLLTGAMAAFSLAACAEDNPSTTALPRYEIGEITGYKGGEQVTLTGIRIDAWNNQECAELAEHVKRLDKSPGYLEALIRRNLIDASSNPPFEIYQTDVDVAPNFFIYNAVVGVDLDSQQDERALRELAEKLADSACDLPNTPVADAR